MIRRCSTTTGAFLGSGYAILDCSPDPDQTDPFLELTHAIQWVDPDSNGDLSSCFIHAYWKDMPTYCKYCHDLGHSAVDCKEAPSNKRKCFYCYKAGHIRSQCPEKVALGKRRKGDTSASISTVPTQYASTIPSSPSDSVLNTTAKESSSTELSPQGSPSLCENDPMETEAAPPNLQMNSSIVSSTTSELDSATHRSKYATPNTEISTAISTSTAIDAESVAVSQEPAMSDDTSSTTEAMDTISPAEDATLSSTANGDNTFSLSSTDKSTDKPSDKSSATTAVRKSSRVPKTRTLMNL
ncbi:hypothetical protein G6F29_010392 [Rhizopus arrhizus]|nr:hypothetical protein G6F21_009606 [Rhizopus arrhizus]KAG1427558.1 hypothetical protein G6F58_000979 [Rhizopus delemar]KAG0802202.1 hypothetical protein G6F22_000496 [Rhizopus arrhizus]KAG0928751.1 hypothetical protein G6F30_012263 [Rhizopus arrhizus]KAG0930171.1 hypothetical protein G6F32_012084 [Rhizopus arrhizus]